MRSLSRENFTRFVTLIVLFYVAFMVYALHAATAPAVRIPEAQSAETTHRNTTGFEPLDRWKDVVLTGDKTALAEFYSSSSEASARTPEGIVRNPAVEEPEFWSSLHSKGLLTIAPGVLEQTSPRGATRLILRIELTFRSDDKNQRFLIPAEQIWVKQDGEWKILITRRQGMGPSPAYALREPEALNPHLYPDPGEAQNDLRAALALAGTEHKRVLMIFGANWCYDCHVLDTALHEEKVEPLLTANYHIVHINIGDGDANTDLAERYQVPLDKGIPSLVILDGNGDLVMNPLQMEVPFAHAGMSDLINFLTQWKP